METLLKTTNRPTLATTFQPEASSERTNFHNRMADRAEFLGLPFYLWNGWAYDSRTRRQTLYSVEDL